VALSRERFSTIGHTDIRFWNPVGGAVIEDWIAALALTPESRILDVGCGRAELLLRVVERYGCAGVGVDGSSMAIDLGRQELAHRLPQANCELRCAPFTASEFAPDSLDLACCVGSSHAIGNYPQTLEVLSRLVKPGGLILVGEGYWQREPAPEYLGFLQSSRDELLSHQGNIELATSKSLQLLRAYQSTPTDWARYEDGYAANLYTFLAANPDDPDADAIRERIDSWRNAYQRWGRDTLGFGLYLLRAPG
jgi:cyclopropane fatty-acyl-phospholipid synthase-like methyltransferase